MDKTDVESDQPASPWLCSCRLGLALMAFVGFMGLYMQRVGMSVAMVCMVNHTAISSMQVDPVYTNGLSNHSLAFDGVSEVFNDTEDGRCVLDSVAGVVEDGPFVWEKTSQGHLHGAFFYGYLASQIPGGMLAERFGGKWVFLIFYLISTVGTLLTPAAARLHYFAILAMRVLVGIGSGAIFPVMHSIWGKWAPPHERTKLSGISYAGAMMGNVVAMPLAGILCEYGFDGGWASIFYVFGIFSLLWCLLWLFLVGDSPASCKRISHEEKSYITHSLKGQISAEDEKPPSTPWLKVLRSPAIWGIIVCNFATDWGLYTFLTNMPTYMFEVLKFDLQSNGLYSALPFIALWANMNISPIVADKLMSSKRMSTTAVRKLFNSIGMFGSALMLVGLAFMDCTQTMLSVAFLTAGVGIMGSSYSGFLVNHMDIAPKFAGSLFGLTNGLGSISGFIAPYVVAVITKNQTREQWQIVFFMTAGILVIGNILYLILGTGELQKWAVDHKVPQEEEMKLAENGSAKANGIGNGKIYQPVSTAEKV